MGGRWGGRCEVVKRGLCCWGGGDGVGGVVCGGMGGGKWGGIWEMRLCVMRKLGVVEGERVMWIRY